MPLTIPEFVARWQGIGLSERSAAQTHFIELCQVLGQPTPAATDPTACSIRSSTAWSRSVAASSS